MALREANSTESASDLIPSRGPGTKHDPLLPLVLAAEHITRLRLGTAIAIAFARSPMNRTPDPEQWADVVAALRQSGS